MRPTPQKSHSRRAGFTLVEILMAISIIALLIGLLLPAINASRRNVRIGQVQTDITALSNALSDFKATYGDYPPSQITIYNTTAGWTSDNASRIIIRRFWPQFNFSVSGGASLTAPITLTGSECLVFFLGGVQDSSRTLSGFSKNASRPFAPPTGTGPRTKPFLSSNPIGSRILTRDGVYEYLDPIPSQSQPYLYFSSYDGSGYNQSDNADKGYLSFYMQSANTAWKPKSFQIISPGFDNAYTNLTSFPSPCPNPGTGGIYDTSTADADLVGSRNAERDNITNFKSGTLAD